MSNERDEDEDDDEDDDDDDDGNEEVALYWLKQMSKIELIIVRKFWKETATHRWTTIKYPSGWIEEINYVCPRQIV